MAHNIVIREGITLGTIYLLHFKEPIGDTNKRTGYAQHYIGYANGDLLQRLDRHRKGTSDVKIVRAFFLKGIPFELARTWTGDRGRERQIKRQGSAKRHCPMCGIKPRKYI